MDNWFMRILRMFTGEEAPPWWLANWKELTVALILSGIIIDAFIYLVRERPAWFIAILRKVGLLAEGDRPDTLRPEKRPAPQEEPPAPIIVPPAPAPSRPAPSAPPAPSRPAPSAPSRPAPSATPNAPIAARPPSNRPVDFSPRPKGMAAAPIKPSAPPSQTEYDEDGEPKRVRLAPREDPIKDNMGKEIE